MHRMVWLFVVRICPKVPFLCRSPKYNIIQAEHIYVGTFLYHNGKKHALGQRTVQRRNGITPTCRFVALIV